jgi:hypothetical protein
MSFEATNPARKLLLSCRDDLKKLFSNIYFHSGRTDSAGGHHNWLNSTGRGFGVYHYHHGFDDHLHPNGICKYGGLFYACPAGNSSINMLGNAIAFEYPMNLFDNPKNNTIFSTKNGELDLYCYTERALADDVDC